jgi:GNAT superfamily N-acetyltransferase
MNPNLTIAPCRVIDQPTVLAIINQSASAYKGHIPADCWHEPYMPSSEFDAEISRGVQFFGATWSERIIGVMGIEQVKDVTLIRHAYVRPEFQRHGIGQRLLVALRNMSDRPVLIGTWAAATWAVRFYEKNGFVLVGDAQRKELLRRYWAVPERQMELAVVLGDEKWRARAAT